MARCRARSRRCRARVKASAAMPDACRRGASICSSHARPESAAAFTDTVRCCCFRLFDAFHTFFATALMPAMILREHVRRGARRS